jgi:hypothetical protein
VTLTIDVLTDDYGSETDFFWVTDDEDRIWDEFGFGDIVSRQFSACLDPKSCATVPWTFLTGPAMESFLPVVSL